MSLSKIKVNNIEIVGVDNEPLVDSQNLIKSGSVSEHGSAFDISSYKSGVSYADLAAALGVNSANVPVEVRRGGMNVKFINSTSSKYEQWRLTSPIWSTDTADWQGVDDSVKIQSTNLVESNAVFNELNRRVKKDFTNNQYNFRSSADYSISEQAANYAAGIKVSVKPGDIIILTAQGRYNYSTWCFATSDNKTITFSANGDTLCNDTVLVAPNNAAYFYANTSQELTGECYVVINKIASLEEQSDELDERVTAIESKDGENEEFKNNVKDILSNIIPTIPQNDDIVSLNMDKESMLYAMGWYCSKKDIPYDSTSYGGRKKRLTIAWCSDIHGDEERFKRFVEYCNHYSDVIDAALTTGDMNGEADIDNGWMLTVGKYANKLKMPFLPVIGNHDMAGDVIVANSGGITYTGSTLSSGSSERNDTYRFAPFVPSGAVKGSGSYFYKDFTEQKIRFIVLNEYELPIIVNCVGFEELSASEKAGIAGGTIIPVNAEIGYHYNTGTILHYKGLYFKVKAAFGDTQNLTFNDIYGTGVWNRTPVSQYNLWAKYFSQAQVNFLVNALNTVPEGFKVVLASHGPIDFTETTPLDENWQTSNLAASITFAQNGYVLQDILSAYNNKGSISKTYRAIKSNVDPLAQYPTYINDNDNHYPDVTVSADFSNSEGTAICYLHGHWHADMNFKSGAMSDGAEIINIGCTCSGLEAGWALGDINRGGIKTQDAFNIISFDVYNNTIQLLRIGADMNDQMKHRLFTKINFD